MTRQASSTADAAILEACILVLMTGCRVYLYSIWSMWMNLMTAGGKGCEDAMNTGCTNASWGYCVWC